MKLMKLTSKKRGGEITLSFTSPETEFYLSIFMKSLLHRKKKNAPLITTRTRTHKNARAHEFTQANKCILTRMQRTRTRVHTHTHTHTQTLGHLSTGVAMKHPSLTNTHTSRQKHKHTRAQAHTQKTQTHKKNPEQKHTGARGLPCSIPFSQTHKQTKAHTDTHTHTQNTHT